MIIITILDTGNRKFDTVVNNRQDLVNLIIVLENSTSVKQYKVSLSEGILVTDLYRDFGLGQCDKFVTQFTF